MEQSVYANQNVFFEDGGRDFQSEDQTDNNFSVTLDNTGASSEARVIAICPGSNYTAAELTDLLGLTVDAVITDGNIIATEGKVVSCAGSPSRVKSFVRSFLDEPRRFTSLVIKVSDTAQFNEPMKVYDDDPFVGEPILRQQVKPTNFESNNVQNDKLMTLPVNHLQFDKRTIAIVKVLAGVSMTIRFNPGAVSSAARSLKNLATMEFSAKGLKRTVATK